jgi:hypothetical protein
MRLGYDMINYKASRDMVGAGNVSIAACFETKQILHWDAADQETHLKHILA